MLRSTFFALGLFVALWGGSFLMIDRMVLSWKEEAVRSPGFRGLFSSLSLDNRQVFDPPEWAGFSLISVGAVTMLYAIALPKKKTD